MIYRYIQRLWKMNISLRLPQMVLSLGAFLVWQFSGNGFAESREVGRLLRSDKEVMVPMELIAHLEKLYVQAYRLQYPKDPRKDYEISLRIPRRLIGINLELENVVGRALRANLEFSLPESGAVIDLDDTFPGRPGDVRLLWRWPIPKVEAIGLNHHVFFIPAYKPSLATANPVVRTSSVGGPTPPSPAASFLTQSQCGKVLDLSKYYREVVWSSGLSLTSASGDFVSVLGGTFVFAYITHEIFSLTSVTFESPSNRSRRCPIVHSRGNDAKEDR